MHFGNTPAEKIHPSLHTSIYTRKQNEPISKMNELVGTSDVPSPSLPLGAQSLIGALSITTFLMERLPGYDKMRRIMRGLGIDMNSTAGAVMMVVSPVLITCCSLSYPTITALIDKYYRTSVPIKPEDMPPENTPPEDSPTRPSEKQTAVVNPSGTPNAIKIAGDPANAGGGTGNMKEGCYALDYPRDQGMTTVFYANMSPYGIPPRWERALSRPNRSMETVTLEGGQKELIIRDIEEYILPVTAKWYANRGLPYRRGYLFYGPPGIFPH